MKHIRLYASLPLVFLLFASGPTAQTGATFTNPYTLDQMRDKQAVVETDMGRFVVQLAPELAPTHVGHFMKLATDGAYNGTIFHRVIKYGLIQGGDPLSKDPAKASEYGTGGLNILSPELGQEPFTAGAVGAVLVPGQPDSAGAQFFVCATDQLALNGQYTLFGRVVDGLEVVQAISAVDASAEGVPAKRVTITSVTIRDTPPVRFVNDTAAELAKYRVTLETTMGAVELEMLPNLAPETVRQFLRLAEAGVYDGILVHRVAPSFVIQTGALAHREQPLTMTQNALVTNLPPEFTDTPNVPGIVSMARGEDPGSGSTSFFICVGECRGLDGQYTVFARVAAGMDVVTKMTTVPVDGEAPRTPIVVQRVTVR